ncbi:hypothetical protein BDN72DRAFT_727575, partial [Pluteus cervinus]
LPPMDLSNMADVDPVCKKIVQDYCAHWFDIRKVLAKHMDIVEMAVLQTFMRDHGALIAGSIVLEFFERTRYEGSTLDLYIEVTHSDLLLRWLRVHYDPTGVTHFGSNSTHMKWVSSLYTFCRKKSIVQLFQFWKPNCVSSMFSASLTLTLHVACLMNVITHSAAYSFFPDETFERKVAMPTNCTYPVNCALYQKYRSRGWTIL